MYLAALLLSLCPRFSAVLLVRPVRYSTSGLTVLMLHNFREENLSHRNWSMKQFILFLLFTFLVFFASHAQQKKFIVRSGIRYITNTHVGEALFNSFGTAAISFFVKHDFRIATSGAFTTDAFYLFEKKKMRAGLSYAHEKLTITEYNNNEATTSSYC